MKFVQSVVSILLSGMSATALAGCTANVGESPVEMATESELSSSQRLLSKSEAKAVLAALDNICGDSWCEGEFNIHFQELSCDQATQSCQLRLNFISESNDVTQGTCEFANITDKSDVMVVQNGVRSYSDSFYERVTECISVKAAQISKN